MVGQEAKWKIFKAGDLGRCVIVFLRGVVGVKKGGGALGFFPGVPFSFDGRKRGVFYRRWHSQQVWRAGEEPSPQLIFFFSARVLLIRLSPALLFLVLPLHMNFNLTPHAN